MAANIPVYPLPLVARDDPDTLFYMTRLEDLVQAFTRSDKPHSHSFYLIMWIANGQGTHTVDTRTYAIAPNQLYFLTPGRVHQWELSADCRGYNLFFDADFFRDRSGHLLYRYPFFQATHYQPQIVITDSDAMFGPIFDFIYREFLEKQPNRYEIIRSAVHIVLELADRTFRNDGDGDSSYLYDRVRHYEELIELQFMTVREVSAYAAQMHLTPHYLNQICKKVVGRTASQLLQDRVILEAQFLLTHTSDSVKEIAFRLGFLDPSYFVRFFRKQTGKTPVVYRRTTRIKR